MTAKIFCRTGEMAGAEFAIDQEATIGKTPDNAIVLPLSTVSAKHARITYDAKKAAYFIEDLQSRNGTFIDGIPVSGKEKLRNLNVITFATCDFIFKVEAEKAASPSPPPAPEATKPPAPPPPPPTPTPPPTDPIGVAAPSLPPPATPAPPRTPHRGIPIPPVAATPASEPNATEKVEKFKMPTANVPPSQPIAPTMPSVSPVPPAPTRSESAAPIERILLLFENPKLVFELPRGAYTVGRTKDNNVAIEHGTISRHHATIAVHADRVVVQDSGSTNGTFIDLKQIEHSVDVRGNAGIRFGRVEGLLILKRAGA